MEIDLLSFSLTDLRKKTGEVLAAASREPIAITKYGKSRFVILPINAIEQLQRANAPNIARSTSDEGAMLIASLKRMMQDID